MASGLVQVRLDAAYLGQDVDSAPSAMGKAKGLLVQNYLTGDSGRLYQRGGITEFGQPITVTTGGRIGGYLRGFDKVLLGFADHVSATRTVAPWVAPYRPAAAANLAKAKTGTNEVRIVTLAPAAASLAITPTSRQYIPAGRPTNFGKFSYAFAYDSVDDTVASGIIDNRMGGFERVRKIMRWNSTGIINPVIYTYMPAAGQALRIHYGQLLALGGMRQSFDVTLDRHALYFTRTLTAADYDTGINSADAASTIWTDPVSGANNILTLPGQSTDFGVEMGRAGRHLAILQRHAVVLLTGFGPDSWQLRTAAEGVGCLDPRSVVEANDGVFFLSDRGYMFFDGVQLEDASKGMHGTLLQAGLEAVGDDGINGGFAVADRLTNDYIMLTIGLSPFASPTVVPTVTFCGLYHIPTNSWSNFTNSDFQTSGLAAPIFIGRSENRQYACDHASLYITTNFTTPRNIAEVNRGFDYGSSPALNIDTKWHSRTAELASPFNKAILHRVLIDYEWIVDGGTAGQYTGPTVTILDGNGTTLDTYTLPSGADAGLEVTRQRHVHDTYVEVNDVQVRIEYTGAARALVKSSILDVFIEYHPGAEKH